MSSDEPPKATDATDNQPTRRSCVDSRYRRKIKIGVGLIGLIASCLTIAGYLYGVPASKNTTNSTTTNIYNYSAPTAKALPPAGVPNNSAYGGGWGPERKLFSMNRPASYPVFNSITDNPSWGDERNFVSVKRADLGNETYSDSLEAIPGRTYTMVIFFENSGADNLAESVSGSIQDAKVTIGSTAAADNGTARVWAKLSAANCITVWDGASLVSSKPIKISFDLDSVRMITNYFPESKGGESLNPSAFTEQGAPIGFDKLDGSVAPTYSKSGYVYANFTVGQA
jgi:hypothetical protein